MCVCARSPRRQTCSCDRYTLRQRTNSSDVRYKAMCQLTRETTSGLALPNPPPVIYAHHTGLVHPGLSTLTTSPGDGNGVEWERLRSLPHTQLTETCTHVTLLLSLSLHSHTHIWHGIISHSIWKTLMGARNMEGILWGICLRGLGLRWGASAAQRPLLIESITVSAAAADAGCLGVLWPPSVPLLQPLTSAWTLLCCLRQPLSTHPPSPPNPSSTRLGGARDKTHRVTAQDTHTLARAHSWRWWSIAGRAVCFKGRNKQDSQACHLVSVAMATA